ncbi:MAG: hypothetical protein JWP57_2390 [Spirosoma sp.]|nr:hypothetical protein [Spirosoma sp.]
MDSEYLKSAISQFEYYKMLGEKTLAQLPDEALFWHYNEQSNSIATLVKHLWGNMTSRWTDLLTTDGEKAWRDREGEFVNDIQSRDELLQKWQEGWCVVLETLRSLREEDLTKIIYIRNQGHSVLEAINRQLAHYPYHIGQLVFVGKMLAINWTSLSIPRGESRQFNADKFAQPKHREHFTEEFIPQPLPMSETNQKLRVAHEQLWQACLNLSIELQTKQVNGKWSAVQHIQHITKGAGAYYRYLHMDKDLIQHTFGTTSRLSKSFDEVYSAYHKRLAEVAKSTSRFDPEDNASISLLTEIDKGRQIVEGIIVQLATWPDADLDKYSCPHPILGNLTAREMLYFTIIHAEHHTTSIRKLSKLL